MRSVILRARLWASEAEGVMRCRAGARTVSDSGELESIVNEIISSNQSQFAAYKAGDMKMFNFFVGQVMKQTKGRANPSQVKSILEKL